MLFVPSQRKRTILIVTREKILYPLSGTIIRDATLVILNGRNGDETRTKHVVITFNGTQFVTMTVDGEPIEVDLSAPRGLHHPEGVEGTVHISRPAVMETVHPHPLKWGGGQQMR